MSRVILHDTTRTVAKTWPSEFTAAGVVAGLVVCLHDSPETTRPHRPSAVERTTQVASQGGTVLVDAASHADLSVTGPDYDTWGLWPHGTRGDFSTWNTYRRHVRRAFEVQAELRAPFLLPGPLLSHPASPEAVELLRMADEAPAVIDEVLTELNVEHLDRTFWLTVAGSPSFWSAGSALDLFVTRLTETSARGWYCVPVREVLSYPISPNPSEIAGICRTVYSLGTWGDPVVVANADLLGLPAIAAGASYIGTGWDKRQRCFEPRAHAPSEGDGGSWLGFVTLERMTAALTNQEARGLFQRAPDLAQEVLPGARVPALGRLRTEHHIRVLARLADQVASAGRGLPGAGELLSIYGRSRRYEQRVQDASGATSLVSQWVEPFERGVEEWIRSEGWQMP